MNTKTLIAIIVVVVLVLGAVVWLMRPPTRDCIHPPALANEEQTRRASDVANALKSAVASSGRDINSDSKFSAALSEALKTQYDKLNDENVTFFLFSQAIYCYLKLNTKTGDRVAEQWTQLLVDRHRQKQGAQGTGEPLTPGERGMLSSDPNGKKALDLLDGLLK